MTPFRQLTLLAAFLLLASAARSQYDFSETAALISRHQRDLGGRVAALISRGGRIIYQGSWGNMDTARVIPIASCSKWLSAALVMTFVDEGRLSLEDSIGRYLPEFTRYGKGGILIKHCLSHTTGLESEPLTLLGIWKESRYPSLEAQVNEAAVHKKLLALPGTEFRYSSIGLNIAGRILDVISHQGFEEIFQQRIARPLGMEHTGFTRGGKAVNPSGGAHSTPADYMRFLEMILGQGSYHGRRILSPGAVSRMQAPSTTLPMIRYAPQGAQGFNYAFGEWIQERGADGSVRVVTSPGAFGSWPYVDNCRGYCCLFFVQKFLIDEKTKDIYLALKKTIDRQFPPGCSPH